MPLAMGWYDVVRMRVDPKVCMNCLNRSDSNCRPLTVDGTPKREIHPDTKEWAMDSAKMSLRGIASTQRVNRSIHVSR